MSFKTVQWDTDAVILLDQTKLPHDEHYIRYSTADEVAQAIEQMVVRGAPAIGVTAALGIALGIQQFTGKELSSLQEYVDSLCNRMARTRPTAVNLFWAIDRMRASIARHHHANLETFKAAVLVDALQLLSDDEQACQALGAQGATLITTPTTVLTHCNAGGLATAGYGTALGVIRAAFAQGHIIRVFADETRPWLQGARLTAWELQKDGIPVTLIADTMAGHLMACGEIGCCIVGADRIAANGDTANKIGTYQIAVLAKEHGIPFYIAAPISTIDLNCPDGSAIPIEERNHQEVTHIRGIQIAPHGIEIRNPSFDVTPARYITAIITEKGIVQGDLSAGISALATKTA